MAAPPPQIIRPDPDPTLLTTENLRREIANLKELLETSIGAQREFVLAKIEVLSSVTAQQFISINDKFAEKDKAVSVGLSAQKEAAAAQQDSNTAATQKMETNFTKLLEQGQQLVSEIRRNTDAQFANINSRLDRGEGQSKGVGLSAGVVVQVITSIGVAVAVIGVVLATRGH